MSYLASMSKLQDQLDQITANTRNLVQPERLEISERAVAELYAAGVEDQDPAGWLPSPGICPAGRRRPYRQKRRSAGPGTAGDQFFPGALVPLLHHRA